MAKLQTVGIGVSEEEKARFDELAEKYVKETGNNKRDFLKLLIESYELNQAKAVMPGRADEIEKVESLLNEFRQMYMGSLILAKSAKAQATAEAQEEIEKSKKLHEMLQSRIDELKSKLTDAEAIKAENDNLRKEMELLSNKLQKAEEARAKAEEERAGLSDLFKSQIQKETERADAYSKKAAEYENLKSELEKLKKAHAVEIEDLKAKYEEKIERYQNRIEKYLLDAE